MALKIAKVTIQPSELDGTNAQGFGPRENRTNGTVSFLCLLLHV